MISTTQNKDRFHGRRQLPPYLSKCLRIAVSAIFWTGIWLIAALLVDSELILPGPLTVLRRLAVLMFTADFWCRTGMTFLRIASGFLLGVISGIITAVLCALSDAARTILSPLIHVLRATPVASFIILVMLWVGYSYVPVIIGAMIVMPVIYQNVLTGIINIDRQLLEFAAVYRLSRFKTLRYICIPQVRPHFVSAAVTAMGLAWKSGVAAEVLARPSNAIGSEIYFAKIYLETPDLFAWTIVVIVLSLLLEKLFRALIGGGTDVR